MREIFVEKSFVSKSILVTGASGFVGKVLVEKLLRSCKGIQNVYILLRSKNGKGVNERFEEFKKNLLFKKLHKNGIECLKKLIVIEADLMMSPIFGISKENLKILTKEINFVFNCAATIRFNESMKIAIQMNIIATRNMLNMAEQFQQLEAFVHVSTAFSNINEKAIYEKIYEPFYDYKTAISAIETDSDQVMIEMHDIALKHFPNNYIFSKQLTEKLIDDRKNLPIAMVRPSIICPAIEEPVRGWMGENSLNGPIGLLLGMNTGLLRSMHGNGESVVDLIPVDFTVNCIIAAAASIATSECKHLQIFNCASSKQMPIKWNQLLDLNCEMDKLFPSTKAIWKSGCCIHTSRIVFLFKFFFLHILPACFIDFGQMICRKNLWALKMQMTIFESLSMFGYFLQREWEFDNKSFILLHKLLSPAERYFIATSNAQKH